MGMIHFLRLVCTKLSLTFSRARHWQIRRVVWTKTVLMFANVGEELVFDTILLSEVCSVEEINKEANQNVEGNPEKHKSADTSQTRFQNALLIKTDTDGHNAGERPFAVVCFS